ncbi:hypothetical protein C8R43DRAFT_1140754 [Mycena crocata]|nr:hypothetical protein C8R43DRAFT_1140754 [Mycena crocata]
MLSCPYESPIFCPIGEEDYNVPLIIGGPGVPAGKVVDTVTMHIDLAPTFFEMLGISASTSGTILTGRPSHSQRHRSLLRGNFGSIQLVNNTYKSARVIGEGHNLFYTVSCDNSRNLYDMNMTNLFTGDIASALGVSIVAEGSSPVARDDSDDRSGFLGHCGEKVVSACVNIPPISPQSCSILPATPLLLLNAALEA